MISTLIAKLAAGKSIIASGSIAGVLAFLISEASTGNLWIAVSLSALSSIAVAWFASRPKVISAQAIAQSSVVVEWANLLKQTNELNAVQLTRLRDKNDTALKIQALMRNSKHNIAGAYQSAVFHIQNLEETMRAHNLNVPPFTAQNFKELTAEEDRSTLSLLGVLSADC